jgi:hypothetical protein
MTSSAHGVARITHLDGDRVGGDDSSETVSDLVDRYWEYVTGNEYVTLEA